MAERASGYDRKERDAYMTPPWAIDALVRSVVLPRVLWEPAAGEGALVDRLRHHAFDVMGTDIHGELFENLDFRHCWHLPNSTIRGIATNPPFDQAQVFIERSLQLMQGVHGMVALLLPTAYDHAKTRAHLFRDRPQFAGQVKLLDRLVFFEPEEGEAAPSKDHCWFVWDWRHGGPPWVRYEEEK